MRTFVDEVLERGHQLVHDNPWTVQCSKCGWSITKAQIMKNDLAGKETPIPECPK